MADFKFEDMEAILQQVVHPAIVKTFSDTETLYRRFTRNEHPWLDDVSVFAAAMQGKVAIPHRVDYASMDDGKVCKACGDLFKAMLVVAGIDLWKGVGRTIRGTSKKMTETLRFHLQQQQAIRDKNGL